MNERIAEAARLFALNHTQQRNSRIAMFFLIAYAISRTAWIALFAQHLSPFAWPGRWLYLTAVLAPHGAALMSAAVEGGRAELGAFYRRIVRRVPFRWAIVAICVPPIIYLVRDAVSVGFHLPHDSFFHRPPRTGDSAPARPVSCSYRRGTGMAWLCSSAIAGTLWTDRWNANSRYRMGILASAALHHQRNAAIWDRVPTVRSRVDGVVDGNNPNHDAHAGQRSCGHALPRLCKRVRLHDVAARCATFRAGTVDHSSWHCRMVDAARIEPCAFDRWYVLRHL